MTYNVFRLKYKLNPGKGSKQIVILRFKRITCITAIQVILDRLHNTSATSNPLYSTCLKRKQITKTTVVQNKKKTSRVPSLALEEPIRALAVTYTELSSHLYKKERFQRQMRKVTFFFFCGALQFPLKLFNKIISHRIKKILAVSLSSLY